VRDPQSAATHAVRGDTAAGMCEWLLLGYSMTHLGDPGGLAFLAIDPVRDLYHLRVRRNEVVRVAGAFIRGS
jgi:hypothetical protein